MRSDRAPLFERLLEHKRGGLASFHVPGHKHGRGIESEALPFFGALLPLDLTELPGLDDLHDPSGAIEEAQRLAADCFGAEETFFLVGGSTAGNMAMILAACGRGDLLLVQRNVHKSVLHGLMLAGARAVFLPPQRDEVSGLPAGVAKREVEAALAAYPEVKGLLLTNPNYYGMGIDLKPIADALHHQGKMLLVDEAHGAHYGFHPAVPPSALTQGADAVVQSTHKMLTAMTMGAMLHVQGPRIDREAIRHYLTMLQSSSPSYPIMASLDLSRKTMHTSGRERLEQGLAAVGCARNAISEFTPFDLLKKNDDGAAYHTLDPFKMTLSDRTGTLSGFRLQEELVRRGCYPEMADPRHVLLLFSLASSLEDAERLADALRSVAEQYRLAEQPVKASHFPRSAPWLSSRSEPVAFDREQHPAQAQGKQTVRLEQAEGTRSAEMIVPYPPGIPVVYPGEAITGDMAVYLRQLAESGARFQGASDSSLQTVRVWKSV